MADADQIRKTVSSVLNRVLTESGRDEHTFADDDLLSSSADLDSLDLAAAVVTLEKELGVDPFRSQAAPVRTFADLVKLYVEACD